MSFFSPEGWAQELAALALVLAAAIWMLRRLRGASRPRPDAASTPDEVLVGDRLSKAMKAAEGKRRASSRG